MGIPFAGGPIGIFRMVVDPDSPERNGIRRVFGIG